MFYNTKAKGNSCTVLLFGIIAVLAFSQNAIAQLGFCSGNSGDLIFTEDFGTGTINNSLPTGTTTYPFASGYPVDGFYTVTNNTFGNSFNWHGILDHTPNDVDGKFLVVNAAATAGEFYRTTVTGLCETTTYEFSAWVLNLVIANTFCSTQPGGTIPINVRFEIWDGTDTNLLASGNTGNIVETATPIWREYGLVFQTLSAQNTVILKMINNGQGGCGNDLAIDDIEFKSCGDTVTVTDTSNRSAQNLCSTQAPFATTLNALPDFAVYSSHFYQWQSSTDGGATWNDLPGENNQTLNISVSSTAYYRAKIAEVAVNLSNALCVSFSNEYRVTVNQLPSMPTLNCWEMATINETTCSWDVTGTQPARPALECWEIATFNTTTCSWEVSGTMPIQPTIECWETSTFDANSCAWEVLGTQPEQPTLECWETATFNTTNCAWDVTGSQPLQPTLECWETAMFNNTSCIWEVSGTEPEQPVLECWETTMFNVTTCSWDLFGTQPSQPVIECWETATFNDTTCSWNVSGTQPTMPSLECWETATFNTSSCAWEISGTRPGTTVEEDFELCEGDELTLQPQTSISNPTYLWSTGETFSNIDVESPGRYEVQITGGSCTFETQIFNVDVLERPIIESITSDGNEIIVNTSNTGDFLYSLDGISFQSNNTFFNVDGGLYSVVVKHSNCDDESVLQHRHFYIPKFFTPNNDGFNDTFDLSGLQYFSTSEVSIYNRYGKLLKFSRNSSFSWNGTLNGEDLPSSDYWYVITIENQIFTGHFTLKR